jgi:hypothetical protein
MYAETEIPHETPNYWVLRVKTGFELYRAGLTHSTRVGRYGHGYLQRAIDDCNMREMLTKSDAGHPDNVIL